MKRRKKQAAIEGALDVVGRLTIFSSEMDTVPHVHACIFCGSSCIAANYRGQEIVRPVCGTWGSSPSKKNS